MQRGENMAFEYRIMTHDDLKACAILFQEAFLQEPWKERWTFEQAFHRLDGIMDARMAIGYVVYDHGDLIGMLCGRKMTYLDETELWIEEVCVSHKYQGKGLGSSLISYVKEELKNIGIKRMVLNTTKGYLSDVFYYKNGFLESDHIVFMSCDF